MTFTRLSRGDLVAAVAALALLLVLSLDWYTTTEGRDLRRVEQQTEPSGAQSGEVERYTDREADRIATNAEDTAWQADEGLDRLILVVLLSAALLATAAAWLRAADVEFKPPYTPSAAATIVGLAGAVLVAFRIAEKPATDPSAVVKLGAPLGLVCVGVLALGARAAWRAETEPAEEETAEAETREPALAGVATAKSEPTAHLWSEDDDPAREPWAWDEAQRDADTDEHDAIGTADFEAIKPEAASRRRDRAAAKKRRANKRRKRRR